jgi:N-acetylglucosamine-6-phosphate deacetylase
LDSHAGYVGAHPIEHIRPPDLEAMKSLVDAAGGMLRMVTLAPEQDVRHRVINFLADEGIVVAAGHCNPSLDELRSAIDAGLTMITHLGNGCPMQMHRHDNIIQRALHLTRRLWISFIGDGVHIPYFALGNYLRCVDPDRVVITTDAMAAAGLPPGRYDLCSRAIELGEDFAVWAPGRAHLIGGAMTMPQVAHNLRRHLGASETDVTRLLYENAARLLGRASPAASGNSHASSTLRA